jgi:hypothetical protein
MIWRIRTVSALAALAVFAVPGTARATLSITAPASKNLGTVATGSSSISAQLGTVTVTSIGVFGASFTATVTTTVFTTGGQTANETIAKSAVSYWSGTATSTVGLGTVATPGQPTAGNAVVLTNSVTAFTGAGTALVNVIGVSWNPTVTVSLPSNAVAGVYTGTITHSVA